MRFHAFGTNYQTAPVSVREAFALSRDQQHAVYSRAALTPGAEFILLSTCNRTEVYLYGCTEDSARLKSVIADLAGKPWPEGQDFSVENEPAIRHVLQVTAGLRSQVIGDTQILSQVKDAYRLAAEEAAVGPAMHRLMHTALRAAKRVVCETALSQGNATISALAITAARDMLGLGKFEGLSGRKVLLLGTGEMGMLALRALKHYNPSSLWVSNRSPGRASFIAEKTGATVIPWDLRSEAIGEADLVIVATGADAYVLVADDVRPRDRNTALIIDIAMPRNVDPAVASVPGYHVIDLDGLKRWRDDLDETRRSEIPRAEAVCDEELAEYVSWVFGHEAIRPAVDTLRDTFEAIRKQEIARNARRFSDADRTELDRITRSIMQKLLSIPIVRMKEAALEGLSLSERVELLNALFSRPGCEDGSAKEAPAGETTAPARRSQSNNKPDEAEKRLGVPVDDKRGDV